MFFGFKFDKYIRLILFHRVTKNATKEGLEKRRLLFFEEYVVSAAGTQGVPRPYYGTV